MLKKQKFFLKSQVKLLRIKTLNLYNFYTDKIEE